MRPECLAHPAKRGVAILMVIAVLAALMAISAPFVFSMIQHGRSARNDLNQQIAREGADAAVAHAIADRIRKTNEYFDQYTDGDYRRSLAPEVLSFRDLRVDMNLPFNDELVKKYDLDTNFENTRGMMWSATMADEQGKINVNTAPPALIGNLLASAILTEGVKKGETQLSIDDGTQFNPNGGLVCMNGEPAPLRYSGATKNSIVLEQGVLYAHPTGQLVYDGRGRLIANALMPGGPKFTPFRSVYDIKTSPGLTGSNALNTEDFTRIQPHLTVESGMSSPLWGHGEKLSDTKITGSVGEVRLENGQGFSPGTLVRIVTNGEPTGFGRVRDARVAQAQGMGMAMGVMGSGGAANDPSVMLIEFEQPISGSDEDALQGGTFVEPQLKNQININTASDEVLAAVFTGVCIQRSKDAVTRATALALVDFLRGKVGGVSRKNPPVFRTHEDFRKAMWRARDNNIISLPQRDALIINATEPNSARLKQCTVTFTYFSHGTFTVEGSGVANSDTGMQTARHTIQELVTFPTPLPGRFIVNYQAGFQELIDQGMSGRVLTYPVILGKHRFKPGAPLDRYARVDAGNVSLDVGECGSMKGFPGVMTEDLWEHCNDESKKEYKYVGYDMRLRGAWVLPPAALPGQQQSGLGGANLQGAGFRGVGTPPTSIELWYRPKGSQQCVFYDEGTQNDRNRVMFSYDPSENGLVIRIWDSVLQSPRRKPVEFIYPITMNAGDWYHIAASWKTSHPGGQEIRVDAQPFPAKDPTLLKFRPGGRLGGDLSLTDKDTLTLEDSEGDDFPKMGALKIGEEVIEYAAHSGNSFTGLYRGARMSAAIKHKAGEWVIPFGFVNNTAEDLHPGNATLSDDLAMEAKTRTRVSFPPNAKPNFVLDTATDKIPVEDATDFPKIGYVTIEGELVYYGAKKKGANGTWELNKLQRAQTSAGHSAPARNLHNGAGVSLASVAISNSVDYADQGIVQIDDEKNTKKVEWIRYAEKTDMDGKHLLVAELANGNPGNIRTGNPEITKNNQPNVGIYRFRHVFGIGDYKYLTLAKGNTSSHTQKTKVIPVIRMNAAHCGGWDPSSAAYTDTQDVNAAAANAADAALIHDSPYGEDGISDISVVELGKQDGDLRWVKQAYMHQYSNNNGQPCPNLQFTGWSFDFYVGLNDFVSRRYPAGTTRYLHWPTGELPDALGASRYVGADKNGEGKLNGDVDEIRVNTYNTLGGRIAMNIDGKGLDSSEEEILVENYDAWAAPGGNGQNFGNNNGNPLNWPMLGGLARIDDELIYYMQVGAGQVQYYADTYPPLNTKPPELNKADRRWINPCTTAHELHVNIVGKQVSKLMRVKRGVLGTKAAEHAVGAQIMLLDAMPVTTLKGAMNAMSDTFNVAEARGFPMEGYAWINDEVLSWKKMEGNTFKGIRYFRGRFGTKDAEHDADEIVRCLPFRYWDRNVNQYDGDGLAFIQMGYRASGAKWYGLEMDLTGTEELPQVPTNVIPHVLVRFDGKPGWDTVPANGNEAALYEFRRKKAFNFSGAEGRGVTADQMEVRVYWEYLSGAFNNGTGADWKRTFSIEKVRAQYQSPLIMRRLDELEKR